jgi:hypothetical protein
LKKIIALLLVVVLFVACGNNTDNLSETTVTPEEIYAHLLEAEFFDPPYMIDIEADRLANYHVNPEDAVSFVAKEAAISAIFIQLIIIEAENGKVNDVKNAMLEQQSTLKDDAFYPQGVEAAANSIVSVRGNLVYLICDVRSQEIEEVLLEFVS